MKADAYRANHTCSKLLSWCAFDLELMCGQFDTGKLQLRTSLFQEIFPLSAHDYHFTTNVLFTESRGLDRACDGSVICMGTFLILRCAASHPASVEDMQALDEILFDLLTSLRSCQGP